MERNLYFDQKAINYGKQKKLYNFDSITFTLCKRCDDVLKNQYTEMTKVKIEFNHSFQKYWKENLCFIGTTSVEMEDESLPILVLEK